MHFPQTTCREAKKKGFLTCLLSFVAESLSKSICFDFSAFLEALMPFEAGYDDVKLSCPGFGFFVVYPCLELASSIESVCVDFSRLLLGFLLFPKAKLIDFLISYFANYLLSCSSLYKMLVTLPRKSSTLSSLDCKLSLISKV